MSYFFSFMSSFWLELYKIDREIALSEIQKPCKRCDGKLHFSNFERKPRGVPDIPHETTLRFSGCCSICRKRQTFSSVRFLGRKVYSATFIFIIIGFYGKSSEPSLDKIRPPYPLKKTIRLWFIWWSHFVEESKTWKKLSLPFLFQMGKKPQFSEFSIKFKEKNSFKWMINVLSFLSSLSRPENYFFVTLK